MNGHGADSADMMVHVSPATDQARNAFQEMIRDRLTQRRAVHLG